MSNPNFVTRHDDAGSDSARFYFANRSDAESFAACYDAPVFESSPNFLWRVKVKYQLGLPLPGASFADDINAAISIGRAKLAAMEVTP